MQDNYQLQPGSAVLSAEVQANVLIGYNKLVNDLRWPYDGGRLLNRVQKFPLIHLPEEEMNGDDQETRESTATEVPQKREKNTRAKSQDLVGVLTVQPTKRTVSDKDKPEAIPRGKRQGRAKQMAQDESPSSPQQKRAAQQNNSKVKDGLNDKVLNTLAEQTAALVHQVAQLAQAQADQRAELEAVVNARSKSTTAEAAPSVDVTGPNRRLNSARRMKMFNKHSDSVNSELHEVTTSASTFCYADYIEYCAARESERELQELRRAAALNNAKQDFALFMSRNPPRK